MRVWGTAVLVAALCCAGCGSSGGERRLRADGRQVFLTAGCGGCHTLAAAGTRGDVGPDFNTSERLSRAEIREQLGYGAGGMPSYARRLSARQKDAVVEFLYAATHGGRR